MVHRILRTEFAVGLFDNKRYRLRWWTSSVGSISRSMWPRKARYC